MTKKKSKSLILAQRVTVYSAVVNTMLSILKIVVGKYGNSKALVVDGIHSFGDLLTDAFVYWGASIGNLPPDDNHPYGHQRIETMVMIILSLFLVTIGVVFAYEALIHFYDSAKEISIYVISTTVISIIANEILYRYTLSVGNQIHSNLLISNAYHHRSDSLSSFVVLIGAIASMYSYPWIDSVAAIIVSFMIVKLGADLIIEGVMELVDTGLDEVVTKGIKEEILKFSMIKKVIQLRTRLMAGKIFVDANLLVPHHLSASEGSILMSFIEEKLKSFNNKIHDITIQLSSSLFSNKNLPKLAMRSDIEKYLNEKRLSDNIIEIYIFYHDEYIEVHALMNKQSNKLDTIKTVIRQSQVTICFFQAVGIS
tara:strand:+ start:1007 stop:2110 length:1104 start_codon:yes stop_codon:yes gene_type:complete